MSKTSVMSVELMHSRNLLFINNSDDNYKDFVICKNI